MGGGGTETSTQTNVPSNPDVNPTLSKLLKGVQSQYGKGTAVFNQSLYPGMSSATTKGVGSVLEAASAGQSGLNSAANWNAGLLSSGGLTNQQKSALGGIGGIGNSFATMATSAGNPSLTEQQLMQVATGKRFGEDAPGYAALRQNALDDALGGVGSSFLTDGRFGSSVMGDAAGEAATGVLSGMDYQRYNDDIARQERALSAIEGQRQSGFTNKMNALGAREGALQTMFGMGQQGTANSAAAAAAAPALFQSTLLPGQAQIAAGQVLDADALAKRQAENDLFRRKNDAGWASLANASSILAGTAGAGGTTSTMTQPGAPWWQQALGAGAIGSGIYKNVWGS